MAGTLQNPNKQGQINNVGADTLKMMINDERTQKTFKEMLGNKAKGFLTSLMNTTNGNKQLQEADPKSILKAAAAAAVLDLPIEPNLGQAYIIPYGKEAQFQIGWRGFYQLAMRTAQYKKINVSELYEGEFESYDSITDELIYNRENRISDKATHFIAYFKLLNGFEKYLVMSKEEIEKHAKTYSKTYSFKNSTWQTNFPAMARKTVLKLLLSKYGILSLEMQMAQKLDQAVIKDIDKNNVEVEYVDNENNINDTTDDIVINESDSTTENNSDDEELKGMFNSEDQF